MSEHPAPTGEAFAQLQAQVAAYGGLLDIVLGVIHDDAPDVLQDYLEAMRKLLRVPPMPPGLARDVLEIQIRALENATAP